jgi:hypothetical protein
MALRTISGSSPESKMSARTESSSEGSYFTTRRNSRGQTSAGSCICYPGVLLLSEIRAT